MYICFREHFHIYVISVTKGSRVLENFEVVLTFSDLPPQEIWESNIKKVTH